MKKYIERKLAEAKQTTCAMIGVELKLTLEERQEIAKLGFTMAASNRGQKGSIRKCIVTWPQSKRAETLRNKVLGNRQK